MKKFLPILLLGLMALCFAMPGPARTAWDDSARQRKLDYIYMEAQHMRDLDSLAEMFSLYDFAYNLDPANTSVAAEIGPYLVQIGSQAGDDKLLEKGLAMMKRQFDENPDNITTSTYYAHCLNILDRNEEALDVLTRLDSIFPTNKEIKYQYAQSLLQTGEQDNIRKSIDEFEKLSVVIGPSNKLTSFIALANLMVGDTIAAINSLHRLIENDPLNAANYVLAGKVFQKLEQPDSVIKYYDRACAVDSTDGYAYYTRAEFYRAQNDTVAFRRETLHAILNTDLEPEDKSEILINFIVQFYNDSTKTAGVDSIFEQVIDRYPHEYLFRNNYANYLYSRNRVAEAADQAQVAIDINPKDPAQWQRLIIFTQLAGRDSTLVDLCSRAVTYHPEVGTLHYFYASALHGDKQYPQAIDQLRLAESLEQDPSQRSDFIGFEGDIFQLMELPDSAYIAYERALAIDPDNYNVMNNFAYMLSVDERELDRAERLSAETLRNNPNFSVWLDTYAWIMFKQRNYAKAKEYIDRAIENAETTDVDMLHHAGDIYFMLGDPDRALEFWQQALALDPDNELLGRKVAHKTYFYK